MINVQNIKALAKEYGENIRGQQVNVGSDFLSDIDVLVEQIVNAAVRTQPDVTRKTLQSTDWLKEQINNGEALTKKSLEK